MNKMALVPVSMVAVALLTLLAACVEPPKATKPRSVDASSFESTESIPITNGPASWTYHDSPQPITNEVAVIRQTETPNPASVQESPTSEPVPLRSIATTNALTLTKCPQCGSPFKQTYDGALLGGVPNRYRVFICTQGHETRKLL